MDAKVEVQKSTRFLPTLAEAVAEWFPELGGRSLAVSEVTINKQNIPTLPLAMVAFARGTGEGTKNNRYVFDMADAFVIEFWLQPERYKKKDGSTTPFWSYYDYEAIRDTLLANLAAWDYEGGERVSYRGLSIEADELAVTLTFAFVAEFRWCTQPLAKPIGVVGPIEFNLCADQTCCLPDCLDDSVPVDSCHPCP
jgi:hypothetical protein